MKKIINNLQPPFTEFHVHSQTTRLFQNPLPVNFKNYPEKNQISNNVLKHTFDPNNLVRLYQKRPFLIYTDVNNLAAAMIIIFGST